ncbi:prepilin peptidase-dependent protein [Dickeya sp. CFBP 2040]|uniref:Type II secretion system protein H n=1 Tax=Dickeya poaceiphila TaxID=568768 RepID=A0A5B8I9Q5_9GAMM|nr:MULTISPECIES: prepilin peptidase-dependent protein [Dickeya]NKI73169.1 prepilin peptidase-dependent protein [Dickeya sp. CFBP 2040]QDX30903.1 prepilin peptidase-dependent protein [Dickeya poaceiphila]
MNITNGRQQGFSLLELIVVIAIVALLTGGGFYNWLAYRQALMLEQHARHLLAFMGRIQAGVYWRNQTESLWLTSSGGNWCIGSGPEPASCPPENAFVFTRASQDVALVETTSEQVVFYGLRNAAQAGHLTLSNSAGRVRLVISARGRLRLCSESRPVQGIPLC